jgi:putative peptidoglycan lipid II flippase
MAATVAMAALLLAINPLVDPWTGRSLIARIIALSVMIGAGATVYFGAVFGLGAYRLSDLKAQLRRKR